jgi:hypothetical protein
MTLEEAVDKKAREKAESIIGRFNFGMNRCVGEIVQGTHGPIADALSEYIIECSKPGKVDPMPEAKLLILLAERERKNIITAMVEAASAEKGDK